VITNYTMKTRTVQCLCHNIYIIEVIYCLHREKLGFGAFRDSGGLTLESHCFMIHEAINMSNIAVIVV
jgi:hypothetical protein